MELTTLEIRILLKCSERLISKRDITQLYSNQQKAERDEAILTLSKHNFIIAQPMPKPGTRKTPIFYKITDEGQK